MTCVPLLQYRILILIIPDFQTSSTIINHISELKETWIKTIKQRQKGAAPLPEEWDELINRLHPQVQVQQEVSFL